MTSQRRQVFQRGLLPAVAICSVVMAAKPSAALEETLELAVSINGYDIAKIGEFVKRGDTMLARPAELEDLGFSLPDALAHSPGLVSLSSIPGLNWRFDGPNQSIDITAGLGLLRPTILQAEPDAEFRVESGLGATLNYDLVASSTAGDTVGSGLFDMRGFSPWGVISTNMIAYVGAAPTGSGNTIVRLDSNYVFSDPANLRRYSLGDFIQGGLAWTRPVRLAGFQIESDFSMRPDLITFPLPAVNGTASVPSTVDVLVDSTRLLSRQVAPGPFEIPQLPVVTGANTVTTTVTNVLGQQVSTTMPFYASSDLLAPGLTSYSAELGWVRQNWGFISDDYSQFAASATYRRGLTSTLTGELHAETSANYVTGGGGLAINVFDLGVASFGAAMSGGAGQAGTLFALSAQRIGRVFSVGASAVFASDDFRDIAALSGDPVPQRQINANIGVALGSMGNFGIAYTDIDLSGREAPVGFTGVGGYYVAGLSKTQRNRQTSYGVLPFQPAQHAHVLSASYSAQVGSVSLFATGFKDLERIQGTGAMIGVTIPLGTRSSASADAGHGGQNGYGEFQVQQSAILPGDLGYQAYASSGDPNHGFGELQYKSSFGLFSGGVDHNGHQTTLRGEAQGAISTADGGIFASNTINDSFAVVDTDGLPGVRVREENREVGRTDDDGRILVPDLRSFEPNHLSIEPTDVPVTDTLVFSARDVRPQDRSGVVVRFPIHRSHAALVRLQDAGSKPIPVGSAATLAATGVAVPVGYDGEAYVEDLMPQSNRLDVILPDGKRCSAQFDYQARPDAIPNIGPLSCLPN